MKSENECTREQNGQYQKGEYRICQCKSCEKELKEYEKLAAVEDLDFYGIFNCRGVK